jgi:regulator of replication initiation timing
VNIFGINTNKRLAQFQHWMEQTVSNVNTIEARLYQIEQKLAHFDVSDVNRRLSSFENQLKSTVSKVTTIDVVLKKTTRFDQLDQLEARVETLESDLTSIASQLEVDAAESDQLDCRVSTLEETVSHISIDAVTAEADDLEARLEMVEDSVSELRCDAYNAEHPEPVPVAPAKPRDQWLKLISNYVDTRRAAGTSSSIDEDDVVALLGLTEPVSQSDQRRIRSIFELLGFSFRPDTEPTAPVAPEPVAELRADWMSILSKYSEEQMDAGNRGVDADEMLRLLGLTDPVSAEDQNHIREILVMLGYREEPPAAPEAEQPVIEPEKSKRRYEGPRRPRIVAHVERQLAAGLAIVEDDILGRPIGGTDRRTMRQIFEEMGLEPIGAGIWVPLETFDREAA